jgi:hypothetical protein
MVLLLFMSGGKFPYFFGECVSENLMKFVKGTVSRDGG